MTVRPAAADDAAAIAEIHVRSWQAAYRGLIPQEYLDSLDPGQRVARWQQALTSVNWPAGGILVAEDSSGVAGFAGYGPTRDADEDADLVGEVQAIYLAPAAWDTGLGRKLMRATLARLAAAGYRQVTLWVLDTNQRARRFYAAAGFGADGAVKYDNSHGFMLRELRYRRPLP